MTERLGFAGMGIMGSGMARNLLAKGRSLLVWNRNRQKAEAIEGAAIASSLSELTANSDIVFICVSDSPDVVEIVRGEHGLVDALRPGHLIVDHSTISPATTRELAALVKTRGASWLDAPVSGGSEGAEKGTLSTMVGGEARDLERVREFLEAYSTTITHVGPVGAGQLVKLVNQILVVGSQLAASEALLFAQQAGLDLDTTLKAVQGGAGGSWMFSNRGPQMIQGDWRPGFTIDLQQKDLRLVLETADEVGAPLPGTALIHQLYRALQASGRGQEGNHALIKALQQMAGIEVD
jgi:3-hydroxyisobutyrate dehydrogenase